MGKRRKLSMLVLDGDKEIEKTMNVTPILWQGHNVVSIFMHYFKKMDLDGSSKLCIHIAEKPENEKQYMCDDYFGVSWYYVEEKYIYKSYLVKKEERNEYYLNILVNALKDIAKMNHRGEEILNSIEEAAQKVREQNYELTLEMKKLSKTSEDKRFRAKVYRHIDVEGEIYYVEIKGKSKETRRYELVDKPSPISLESRFHKSFWEENKFILMDRLDHVWGMVEVEEENKLSK